MKISVIRLIDRLLERNGFRIRISPCMVNLALWGFVPPENNPLEGAHTVSFDLLVDPLVDDLTDKCLCRVTHYSIKRMRL